MRKNILLALGGLLFLYVFFSILLGIKIGLDETTYLRTKNQVLEELISTVEKNGCKPSVVHAGKKEMSLVNFSCVQPIGATSPNSPRK